MSTIPLNEQISRRDYISMILSLINNVNISDETFRQVIKSTVGKVNMSQG